MEEVFPILDVENDVIVSVAGDLTAAWQVTFPEAYSVPSDGYDIQYGTWIQVLKALRKGTRIHLQSWYDTIRWSPDPERSLEDRIDLCSDRHFAGRRCLRSESYLFLTLSTDVDHHTALCSPLVHRNLIPRHAMHSMEEFGKCASEVETILNASRPLCCRRLGERDLLGSESGPGLIDRHLMLDRSGDLMLKDIRLDSGLTIGQYHTSTLAATSPIQYPEKVCESIPGPRHCGEPLSQLSPGGVMLPFPHVCNLYITLPDPAMEISAMERTMRHMQSLGRYSTRNRTAAGHIGEFLKAAGERDDPPARVHFDIMTWSHSTEVLERNVADASASLRAAGFTPHRASALAPILYWASIPGAEGYLPASETFLTLRSSAAALLPSERTVESASISTFGIRLTDRLSGEPVQVDISDEPMRRGITANRNKFVLGPSGSGKSFFMNHMLRHYYCQGAAIVIIDCGHSYLPLCRHIRLSSGGRDGRYVTYGDGTSCLSCNPFAVPPSGYDLEQRESIVRLTAVLYKRPGEALSRSEEVAISNAVTLFAKHVETVDGPVTFDTFHRFMADDFARVMSERNTRERDFDLKGFLDITSQFTSGGQYGMLLNSPAETLMEGRFTVFDLEAAKDNETVLAVLATLVMEGFIRLMRRNPLRRKVIVVDEAWKAISSTVMAGYIKYLYRTVRKYFGEAITVTQDLDDLVGSPTVRDTIVNNSDCRIITDSHRYASRMDTLTSVLGIPSTAAGRILSLNRDCDPSRRYREVWIGLGSGEGTVYGVEASKEEYSLYTTEPTDRKL